MSVLYVDLEQEWRAGQDQALLTLRVLLAQRASQPPARNAEP